MKIAILDGDANLNTSTSDRVKKVFLNPQHYKLTENISVIHGTVITNVIFGSAPGLDNRTGLLIPIYRLDKNSGKPTCTESQLATLLLGAKQARSRLANISAGISCRSSGINSLLSHTIDDCFDNDMMIVSAAGNEGSTFPNTPARHPKTLVVGALDQSNTPMRCSNVSPEYSGRLIMAPGQITSDEGTLPISGTSIAAAYVTRALSQLYLLLANSNEKIFNFIKRLLNSTPHKHCYNRIRCWDLDEIIVNALQLNVSKRKFL